MSSRHRRRRRDANPLDELLPEEMFVEIMAYLPERDRARLALTSRRNLLSYRAHGEVLPANCFISRASRVDVLTAGDRAVPFRDGRYLVVDRAYRHISEFDSDGLHVRRYRHDARATPVAVAYHAETQEILALFARGAGGEIVGFWPPDTHDLDVRTRGLVVAPQWSVPFAAAGARRLTDMALLAPARTLAIAAEAPTGGSIIVMSPDTGAALAVFDVPGALPRLVAYDRAHAAIVVYGKVRPATYVLFSFDGAGAHVLRGSVAFPDWLVGRMSGVQLAVDDGGTIVVADKHEPQLHLFAGADLAFAGSVACPVTPRGVAIDCMRGGFRITV